MEGGLAWVPRVIFKGVINSKSSQDRLWLGRNNVNNPRASGDALALDCGGCPSFCSRSKGKCLRMQTEPGQGPSRRGSVSRASGLKWRSVWSRQDSGVETEVGLENV